MVSINSLKKVAKTAGISADDMPQEFEGQVIESKESHDDQTDSEIVTIRVKIPAMEDRIATITYKPSHCQRVAEELEKMGIKEMDGHTFKFVKEKFKMGFDRPIPKQLVS